MRFISVPDVAAYDHHTNIDKSVIVPEIAGGFCGPGRQAFFAFAFADSRKSSFFLLYFVYREAQCRHCDALHYKRLII